MTPDYNYWYYTLSTVAQTLASMLGLIGVFVVLKLTGVIRDIIDYRERGKNLLRAENEHLGAQHDVGSTADLEAILTALNKTAKTYQEGENPNIDHAVSRFVSMYEPMRGHSNSQFIKDTADNLCRLMAQHRSILDLVKPPAIFSGTTIALCVAALSVGHLIGYQIWLVWLTGALGLVSIYLIGISSWGILKKV